MTKEDSQFSPKSRHIPKEYLEEAQILLAYAAQRGLEVDKNVIGILVRSVHEAETQTWTTDLETQFWIAFNSLARSIQPVTVDSLRATKTYHKELLGHCSNSKIKRVLDAAKGSFSGSDQRPPAHRTVRAYQSFTLLAMFLLLFIHAYWLIGSAIVNDIEKTLPDKMTKLKKDKQLLEEKDDISSAEEQEIKELEATIVSLKHRMNANYISLKYWNLVWKFWKLWSSSSENSTSTPDSQGLEKDIQEKLLNLQQAGFILQVIQFYVLPLLYGLLGALAYVLRVLNFEIRNLVYAIHSNIGYRLRIQLGAVSGLAIGWFFDSEDVSTLSSLSPLALAFLAGYSVEVLFSLMDRLIYTFSTATEERFGTSAKKD